jgi:MFS family permease
VPSRGRVPAAVAFWVVAYAFLVNMVGTTLPTPLYPIYERTIGFSGLMVTVIFAVYAVGVIAALLLFGALSDQVGRRRAMLPGLALSAASAVIFLLAHGLAPLFAGRVLSGLSAGIFTGTGTAALTDIAPERQRGRATLVASAVNMLGLGTGTLLTGFLAAWAPDPLRLVFVVDLVLLVPAVLGIWLIPEPGPDPGGFRLQVHAPYVPPEMRGAFATAAIAGFAGFAVLGLFSAVTPAFLAQVLDEPNHAVTGAVVFSAFAGSGVGQLALERTTNRIGLRLGCGILMAAMVVLAAALIAEDLPLLVVASVVAGIGQGLGFRAALTGLGAESPEAHRGAVASSLFVVAYTAISVPVVGFGVAAEAIGLRSAGIAFSAVVFALAGAALALLLRRRS